MTLPSKDLTQIWWRNQKLYRQAKAKRIQHHQTIITTSAGLVVLNSLSFCLSVKLLISPSYLNEIFVGYSNLGCRLFSFITLSMSCHSLLAWRVPTERPAVILMGIPLCVICFFPLADFNICSLCLIFVNLINMCLGVFHLVLILFGTLWVSWTWVIISFPILGKFSTIMSSSIGLSFCFPLFRCIDH